MAYEIQPQGTFRGLVELRSPGWLRGETTSAFFQVAFGTVADEGIHGVGMACRMHLLTDPQCPDDALPVNGEDRLLPQYDAESADAYRARLINAWAAYNLAASHTRIEDALLEAGFGPAQRIGTWGAATTSTGAPAKWGMSGGYAWGDRGAVVIFKKNAPGPRGEPAPYATQFWVRFGNGYHPVTGSPVPWGEFPWDGAQQKWGTPAGFTTDFYRTTIGIIRKWKCSRYVFRGYMFQIGGILTWGQAGHKWGEAGQVWGGVVNLDLLL